MRHLLLFLLGALLWSACNKEENALQRRSALVAQTDDQETFETMTVVYKNQHYPIQLQINENKERIPQNMDVVDALNAVLPEEFEQMRFSHDLSTVYLFDNYKEQEAFEDEWYAQNQEFLQESMKTDAPSGDNQVRNFDNWLVFYKNCQFDDHYLYAANHISKHKTEPFPGGDGVCSFKYEQINLKNVPRGRSGNWNDVVSKIRWDMNYLPEGFHSGGKYQLAVFKDVSFPNQACKREIINITTTTGHTACLNKYDWCNLFWEGDLNDDISSWRFAYCHSFWDINARCDCLGPYGG